MNAETTKESNNDAVIECTCGPGEILYIPTDWWHSTLNIGCAVFISTFI